MGKFVDYLTIADRDWQIYQNSGGGYSDNNAVLTILLDIRAELKKLNSLLHCRNFITMPDTLRQIQENTKKSRMTANEPITSCCGAPFIEPGWPDSDFCSDCKEHAEPDEQWQAGYNYRDTEVQNLWEQITMLTERIAELEK